MDSIIGVDTLKVFLSDFEVSRNNKLTIQPASFTQADGEVKGEYTLWNNQGEAVRGNKAYFNDEQEKKVFISLLSKGDGVKCFIQCSLPKVFNGNNYGLLTREETVEAVEKVRKKIEDVGIKGNFQNAKVSRIDTTRNILTEDRVQSYNPVWNLLQGKRMKNRTFGETHNWGNTQKEICAYDKVEEMKMQDLETVGLPDTLRLEVRLKNAKKVRDTLGLVNVSDLLKEDGYRNVQDKYLEMLESDLLRYNPKVIDIFGQRDLEKQLRQYQVWYKRNFFSRFKSAKGVETLLKEFSVDVISDAVLNVSGGKKSARQAKKSRMKSDLFKEKMQIEQVQTEFFMKRNFSDLYEEIRDKALAKVA
jgi:hypothetical protein